MLTFFTINSMQSHSTNIRESKELAFIDSLIKGFSKPANRLNSPHESDSEIIRLPSYNKLLAVTTDTIYEELQTGLYNDPFQIGWMTVTVNVSDLAAVGASPIGILISEGIPKKLNSKIINKIQEGIATASKEYNIPILGGDTNQTEDLLMGGTALGIIDDNNYMKRSGLNPGDNLYTTAKAGIGTVCSFSLIDKNYINHYLPKARITEGIAIKNFSEACIDTSDGLIAGLDQLIRSSDVGIELQVNPGEILCSEALSLSEKYNLPKWIFLNGPHGDFELIFSIAKEKMKAFTAFKNEKNFEIIYLGKVIETRGLYVDGNKCCNTGLLRNLFDNAKGDPKTYLNYLLHTETPWTTNT